MEYLANQIFFILETVIFASVLFMQFVKKNSSSVYLYMAQSIAIVSLLVSFTFISGDHSNFILFVIFSVILVKIIIAPYFFLRIIKKNNLTFSDGSYLKAPITLLSVALLILLTRASFFQSLVFLSIEKQGFLMISLSAILASLFVIINRKGVISQVFGLLSLENSIVSFALFAGLEQDASLQLGITFDILIWTIITVLFTSMIYKQFGTIDVNEMKKLTE